MRQFIKPGLWLGIWIFGWLLCMVLSVITPPDVISQLLLAIPMCLLYEAGIIAAKLVGRKSES